MGTSMPRQHIGETVLQVWTSLIRALGFACTAFDQVACTLIVASAPIAVKITHDEHAITIYMYPNLTRRGAEDKQGSWRCSLERRNYKTPDRYFSGVVVSLVEHTLNFQHIRSDTYFAFYYSSLGVI